MNISDLFIIYLTCGAPCGVYFFLQNRKKINSKYLWLKSFLTMVVWIPYAFVLLHDFTTKRKRIRQLEEQSAFEARLSDIQKQLVQIQIAWPGGVSLFEFREALQRYAGLTLACNSPVETFNRAESEIFRIALRDNSRLAAQCLHRRNRLRLKFHQTLARKDFLQFILKLRFSALEPELLKKQAVEFVDFLKDEEARAHLEEIFAETLQSGGASLVQSLENEVWKPQDTKSQPSKQMPVRLKTFIAATHRKD